MTIKRSPTIRMAALLALVMIATAGTARAADVQEAPCTLHRLVSLDMSADPEGTISVPAKIDDHDVRLEVDTGSVYSSIGADQAQAFGLTVGQTPFAEKLAGGFVMDKLASVDRMTLGTATATKQWLYVIPTYALDYNVDGLLGPNIISNYDVEIDFYNGKFNLFDPDHRCPGKAVYWTQAAYARIPMTVDDDYHISISVMLDGKPITAFVDTGAQTSFLSAKALHDVLGIDEKNPALRTFDSVQMNRGGTSRGMYYPFTSLSFQGVVVNNPDIAITADPAITQGGPDLVLGASVLRQLHLYIAYKEQMLYVTPAEAH